MSSKPCGGFAAYPMVEEAQAVGVVAGVYAALLDRMPFVPSLFKSLAVCPAYLVLAAEQAIPALADPAFGALAARLASSVRTAAAPPSDGEVCSALAGFVAPLSRMLLLAAGLRLALEGSLDAPPAPGRVGAGVGLSAADNGDVLAVWKLDRLGRSVKDVLTIADDLHQRGVGLRILTGKLAGTYSPSGEGKFFFTMMAAFAELERDILHERTLAGLVAARAQGRVGGRPTVMDADKLAAARARRAKGESPTQIAAALGVSRASVYRHLAAAEQPTPDGGAEQARASVG